MILRPYRRIRALQARVATLERVLADEHRRDRWDLHDAITIIGRMHDRFTQQAEALDAYDTALRLLSDESWQRKLEASRG